MKYEQRVNHLREYMESKDIQYVVLIDPMNQYYFTGFLTISYSRPIITLISKEETFLIVPELEKQHAQNTGAKVLAYSEVPGSKEENPWNILLSLLKNIERSEAGIGVEMSKIPVEYFRKIEKYGKCFDISQVIRNMRIIKDEDEISLIRAAAKLVSQGVEESIGHAAPNISEIEIDAIGNFAILKQASKEHGDVMVSLFSMSPSGPERSTMPHVHSTSRKLERGDVVIHSRQVALLGYRAECERTFFVHSSKHPHLRILEVALESQREAEKALKPGASAAEIDRIAREVIEDANYGRYFPHRTGHGLGLDVHEAPYLVHTSKEKLRSGMVVTVEPGIYIPGMGGFRNSDTYLITDSGYEKLTTASSYLE